ncbi:hypothetical protein V6M85_03490 [Sulfolobus tengchongensis]|uniref:Ethanolamine ammonia lyase-activating protein n=1 Tax=Sulfolobus tengchongensis TaxID=207809 RepID=A0AAX4L2L2_9CREN
MPQKLVNELHKQDYFVDFAKSEGVPLYDDFHVDLLQAKTSYWERFGVNGAWVYLKGASALDAAYILDVPPQSSTKPQRYLLDEVVVILDGEGYTEIWYNDDANVKVEWRKWTLFKIPHNALFKHVNVSKDKEAKILSVTQLPLIINAARDNDLIFNSSHISKEFLELIKNNEYLKSSGIMETPKGVLWKGFVLHNIASLELPHSKYFGSRGTGTRGVNLDLGPGLMAHISEMPAFTYKKAHVHGPSATILILKGEGYSLMWYGSTKWSEAWEKVKIDWKPGFLFIPPDKWFHQHFNVSAEPARYLAIHSPIGHIGEQNFIQIEYYEEDPEIRKMYEYEMSKRGLKSQMKPELYQKM